jgi:glycosyltransferase involved in cell wall biosynthesis
VDSSGEKDITHKMSGHRPKLSLAMIVKNEARCLARCLRSIKHVVDEIVIVDTGSTDDTIKIAAEFGGKISHFEWVNDFSAARNFALDQSSETGFSFWMRMSLPVTRWGRRFWNLF